jgi:hypothetical protein
VNEVEFHELMREKYIKAGGRRRWTYAILIVFLLLIASVLVPVVSRLMRQMY